MSIINSDVFLMKSFEKKEVKPFFDELDKDICKAANLILLYNKEAYEDLLDVYTKIANGQALHSTVYSGKTEKAKAINNKHGFSKLDAKFLTNSFNALMYRTGSVEQLPFVRDEYIKLILKYKDSLSHEEGLVLTHIQNSITTKIEKLTKAFLKKIVKCTYTGSNRDDDNFQSGCIAFIKAIGLYDQNTNNSFSTYAQKWITGTLKQLSYDSFLIPIPQDTWNEYNKVKNSLKKDETVDDCLNRLAIKKEKVFKQILVTQTADLTLMTEPQLEQESSLKLDAPELNEFDRYLEGLTSKESWLLKLVFGSLSANDITIPKKYKKEIENEILRQSSN